MAARIEGAVRAWFAERRFGFITGSDGGDYFFHGANIIVGRLELKVADRVKFEPVRGPRLRVRDVVRLAPVTTETTP